MTRQDTQIQKAVSPSKKRFQDILPDDEIDISALLRTLWLGKWLIAVCTVVGLGLGAYFAYVAATPIYRSSAVVILDTNQASPVLDLPSVVSGVSGDSTEVKSEIEVLRARSLIGRVVDRLDLVSDPEFNAELRPDGLLTRWKTSAVDAVKSAIALATGAEISAAQGGADLTEEERVQRVRDSAITALLQQLRVQNVTGSLVFNITVESEDARKSARIADTLVETYIVNQIDVKFQAMEQATEFLTTRVAELKIELEEAEAGIAEFSAGTDLVSLEIIQESEIELSEFRDRLRDARETKVEFDAALQDLQAATTISEKTAITDDTQLSRFATNALTDPLAQAAFDARFDALLRRAEQNAESADQQIVALEQAEDILEQQIATQSRDLINLQQLTREAEATRLLYEYFLTRLKETSAQQGIQQADSRILSNAVLPEHPASPQKGRILGLAGILGLLIGAGLVLLRAQRRRGFQTATELERHTGQTVLGQIPIIPGRKRRKVLDYLIAKPASAAAEAIRDLRTSVMLADGANPPQVIVSTSSIPGEGKTTTSLALSQNLAAMGRKVLLIEGDIRRRTLDQYFEVTPRGGIVSVLSGEKKAEDVIHAFEDKGFDVIFGEATKMNAADVFSNDSFGSFIGEQRKVYDVIIIDTPPVLVVPDSRIIARLADATLFTVKWDSTSQMQVDEALRLIENANQEVTGLILSQISAAGMKRYGYGGQYGAYAAYGAQYYTN